MWEMSEEFLPCPHTAGRSRCIPQAQRTDSKPSYVSVFAGHPVNVWGLSGVDQGSRQQTSVPSSSCSEQRGARRHNMRDGHKNSSGATWRITTRYGSVWKCSEILPKNAENETLNPCSLWFFQSFWCTKPRNPWCDYSDVILKDSLLMVLLHEEFLIPIREREIKQGSEDLPSTIVDFLKKSCPSKPHYDACVLGG